MFTQLIHRLTGINEIDARTESACQQQTEGSALGACAREFGVGIELDAKSHARIPRSGPAIVVANHPTGFAEGVALPALLDEIREDVMCVGHVWFERWPQLAKRMFLVDPNAKGSRGRKNAAALRAAVDWVRDGHMLLIFPAAKVARGRWSGGVEEGRWRSGLELLARRTAAPIVPVSIQAEPGRAYRWASALHPAFGAATLGRELLERAGRPIPVVVHAPLHLSPGDREAVARLRRSVVEAAAHSGSAASRISSSPLAGQRRVNVV